jgi:hypothetical protein
MQATIISPATAPAADHGLVPPARPLIASPVTRADGATTSASRHRLTAASL